MSAEMIRLPAARRMALAAQGFAEPRPTGRIDARHFDRVLDRVGLLQIDSVNVLSRSHYLPVFARLGPYPREALDRYAWGRDRRLFEYWAHAASLVPLRLHPHLRWRMARAAEHAWGNLVRLQREKPGFIDSVRHAVEVSGPLGAGKLDVERRPKQPGSMWNWHDGKIALEWLFYIGEVTCASRPNFERLYDLTERVLPRSILGIPTPDPADGQRELVRVAARACGVATEPDLRDYFNLKPADSRARVAELVESGELVPVTVEGWRDPAYRWHEARLPRRVSARALLSPFDSLIWFRPRTERLFGFHYRIGIYTPAEKRVHGYYVLPFLLGDRLVARVDLKADRQAGVLRVQAAFGEDGADPVEAAGELAEELRLMAGWLDLSDVAVAPRGDLSDKLRRELSA